MKRQKVKPTAKIMVPDNSGGMVEVQDRRFESDWLIDFDIPREQSDDWFEHLQSQCEMRKWSCSGVTQMEAGENSGTITVHTGDPPSSLVIVWERRRNGPLRVRAKPVGTPGLSVAD